MIAYKSFRLYITRNSGGGNGYMAVSEWRMYEDEEGATPNVLVGGVASASHTNGSYVPANAFDGVEDTTWESTSISGDKWLRYDLPEPVMVRSIYVSHNRWTGERPRDFKIQGSNDDGASWDDLTEMKDFLLSSGPAGQFATMVRSITGRSILHDGRPAIRVRIYDWNTGNFLVQVTPDEDGYWGFNMYQTAPVMLVHVPPEGYRPLADGPITLKPRW